MTRYRVVLSASGRRDLARLPEAVAAAVMEFMAGPLAQNPHRVGKPLVGDLTGRYSARRGEYRLIYTIDEDAVIVAVLTMRHRRDAYRR